MTFSPGTISAVPRPPWPSSHRAPVTAHQFTSAVEIRSTTERCPRLRWAGHTPARRTTPSTTEIALERVAAARLSSTSRGPWHAAAPLALITPSADRDRSTSDRAASTCLAPWALAAHLGRVPLALGPTDARRGRRHPVPATCFPGIIPLEGAGRQRDGSPGQHERRRGPDELPRLGGPVSFFDTQRAGW